MKNHSSPLRSERGGLLITAMIFSAIIGVSIVSFIRLGRTTGQISNRGLYNNAAMNLAENGLEEAMYSINQMVAGNASAWSGWTTSGAGAQRKWTGTTFDQNATGQVRVYVDNYTGLVAPTLYARSTVTMGAGGGADIEKWIMVQLSKTSKFSNGLVAKQTISFSGNNATVDSWNSDPDNDGDPSDVVPYSAGVANDAGSVGSISVSVSAVAVQNADIWGYAATGGAVPSVGSQGRVGPYGTSLGSMNPDYVSTDFSASFDPVTAPTSYTYTNVSTALPTSNITGAITLPDDIPGATIQADGKYYIECGKVQFNNATFAIAAGKKVVLKCTDPTTSIDIGGGSGAMNIGSGGSLELYADGAITVSGQGILNGGTTTGTANQPINLQIYGTSSDTQNISIAGNGVLSCVVYAPNGSVKINGNGDVMGSVVANDITVVGNALFHYDESLSNFGGGNPYRVAQWTELTNAAARTAVSGFLSF